MPNEKRLEQFETLCHSQKVEVQIIAYEKTMGRGKKQAQLRIVVHDCNNEKCNMHTCVCRGGREELWKERK